MKRQERPIGWLAGERIELRIDRFGAINMGLQKLDWSQLLGSEGRERINSGHIAKGLDLALSLLSSQHFSLCGDER